MNTREVFVDAWKAFVQEHKCKKMENDGMMNVIANQTVDGTRVEVGKRKYDMRSAMAAMTPEEIAEAVCRDALTDAQTFLRNLAAANGGFEKLDAWRPGQSTTVFAPTKMLDKISASLNDEQIALLITQLQNLKK